MSMTPTWYLYCYRFTCFSGVSIADFEQIKDRVGECSNKWTCRFLLQGFSNSKFLLESFSNWIYSIQKTKNNEKQGKLTTNEVKQWNVW